MTPPPPHTSTAVTPDTAAHTDQGARERGDTDDATCVVLCVETDPSATAPSISKEALEAAGRWAGLGVDGGLVVKG